MRNHHEDHGHSLAEDLTIMDAMIARRRALKWFAGAGTAALVSGCGGTEEGSASSVDIVSGSTPTPTPTTTPTSTPTPTPASVTSSTSGILPTPGPTYHRSGPSLALILPLTLTLGVPLAIVAILFLYRRACPKHYAKTERYCPIRRTGHWIASLGPIAAFRAKRERNRGIRARQRDYMSRRHKVWGFGRRGSDPIVSENIEIGDLSKKSAAKRDEWLRRDMINHYGKNKVSSDERYPEMDVTGPITIGEIPEQTSVTPQRSSLVPLVEGTSPWTNRYSPSGATLAPSSSKRSTPNVRNTLTTVDSLSLGSPVMPAVGQRQQALRPDAIIPPVPIPPRAITPEKRPPRDTTYSAAASNPWTTPQTLPVHPLSSAQPRFSAFTNPRPAPYPPRLHGVDSVTSRFYGRQPVQDDAGGLTDEQRQRMHAIGRAAREKLLAEEANRSRTTLGSQIDRDDDRDGQHERAGPVMTQNYDPRAPQVPPLPPRSPDRMIYQRREDVERARKGWPQL